MINTNIIKKINSFLKNASSLKYLDPNIFDKIDELKENNDIDFNNYYLEYIASLPKLDFDTARKIAREVYELYGKGKEFDSILEKLINNYNIDAGSLNKEDDNCITKASESRVLLSGTYYDVILLCHEIGHKLRYDNLANKPDIMDSFLFETPSIILELGANDYLRDKYGIDLNADQLRKTHILSIRREDTLENKIFSIIIQLLKERKLNVLNIYRELINNKDIVEYLNREGTSIEECFDEAISGYSYDIGYILGSYTNSSDNKIDLLNMFLKYKDKGINMPFTIDNEIIKEALDSKGYSMK